MTPARRYFNYPRRRVNYVTHISTRHRCVYVEVPKAGCSVVKRVLQYSEVDGDRDRPAGVGARPVPLAAGGPDQRAGSTSTRSSGPPVRYFRFSFVRNPYSRALSCYLEKIAGEQWLRDLRLPELGFHPQDEVSFADFLNRVAGAGAVRDMDVHWAPQHFLLSLRRVQYGFLGRFENFQGDLRRLVDILALDVPEELLLRRTAHVTSAASKLHDYYDDETVALVQQIYGKDFDALGYGRDLRFGA